MAILARCWSLARECKGQIVLLTGEPGIGKSRLVQVLLERTGEADPRISAINAHPFMFQRVPSDSRADSRARPDSVPRIAQSKGSKLRSLMAQAGEVAADEVGYGGPTRAAGWRATHGDRA